MGCIISKFRKSKGTPASRQVAPQQPPRPVVAPRARPAQGSDIKLEGTAVTNPGHKGGSDCCTPTAKADTPLVARRTVARTAPTSRETSYTLVPKG